MTDDPFELFKRTLDQFDPSDGFDPANFGAFSWPITPFPTGEAAAKPLSPEAGTKRAVTQLFTAIEGVAGDSPGTAGTPLEFWQKYAEQFGSGGFTSAEASDSVGAMFVGTYQVWLYSLAQLLVESYTLRLLYDRLVNEEHRNRLGTQEWLWELPQADREQLLRRCTDIEDDLVDEMQALRGRRNELFYDLGTWDTGTQDDAVSDARRSLRVLTELETLVSDGDAYQYLPAQRDDEIESGKDDDEIGSDDDGAGEQL